MLAAMLERAKRIHCQKGHDKNNAIPAGCGFNIRKLLRAILLWLFKERLRNIFTNLMALVENCNRQYQSI